MSVATCLVFALRGEVLFGRLAEPFWLALIFAWLFGVILGSALAVVRHADRLAGCGSASPTAR